MALKKKKNHKRCPKTSWIFEDAIPGTELSKMTGILLRKTFFPILF